MGLGDFIESIDWETVGKVVGCVAGATAVGGVAYYVGKQKGHTDGMSEGYINASNEYEDKFQEQERQFKVAQEEADSRIESLIRQWTSRDGNAPCDL